MDKKKFFLFVSLVIVAAIVGLTWFFVNRALENRPRKTLLDKDFTKIQIRQENDKRFAGAKKYFVDNSDMRKPTQEMARQAAYLADAKKLADIYASDKALGDKKDINWLDVQLFVNASYYGDPALIKQLYGYRTEAIAEAAAKGVNKEVKEAKAGEITVLLYAAGAGNIELFKFYENAGLDLKAVDARGWNALHFAAAGGNPELVKYLVEQKGFEVNAKNKYGQTAFDYAKTTAVAEYLKSKDAKSGTQLR